MFEFIPEMTVQTRYRILLIAGEFYGLRMGKAFYADTTFQGSHKIDNSAFFCLDNVRIRPGRNG